MGHIALLGDSVFDNGAYVNGGPDVTQQLRSILPADWRASCYAVDGSTSADVRNQLERVPRDATHLVVSTGGNDALRESGVLDQSASSVGEALQKLALARDRFARDYGRMLEHVCACGLKTAICTIYDARFPDPERRRLAAAALALINDYITREAVRREIDVLDVRVIFDDDGDFANPIEPSTQGGMKLAAAIARFAVGAPGHPRLIR